MKQVEKETIVKQNEAQFNSTSEPNLLPQAIYLLTQTMGILKDHVISQELKEKKKSKLIKTLNFLTNNKIIISILSGFTVVASSALLHVYTGIQNNLDLFDKTVGDVIGANEEMYVSCTSFYNNKNLLPYFQQKSVLDARHDLKNKLEPLINQWSLLGKNISRETYISTGRLICQSGTLISSGMNMCSLSALDTNRLTILRKEIQKNIKEDKIQHQQFGEILKDLSHYTISFFSRKKTEYDPLVCKMGQITIQSSYTR